MLNAIKQNFADKPLRILDIGCGEGYVIDYLSRQINTAVEFWGLDKNKEALRNARVMLQNDNKHRFSFIEKNIDNPFWIDNLGSFDVVLCVNIFHEIYSNLMIQKTLDINRKFFLIINKLFKLVDHGGLILLFDGIEQDCPFFKNVEFKITDEETMRKFDIFVKEYKAIPISFEKSSNGIIKGNLKDFTRFITKLRFIASQTWEIERYESYQYYTEKEFSNLFLNNKMTVVDNAKFICNIKEWQEHVTILNDVRFPEECYYIIGKKI